MPRIRSIKPEFCVSDQIVECSTNARLLFVLMWMFCDDRGVHPASLTKLKMECFPADPFTEADMKEWMNQLIKARLIARFLSDGLEYWHVRGWKHQKIDRPSFKYPAPEGIHFDEYSTNDRGSIVGRHPPESMGRDVDGKGVEGSASPPAPSASNTQLVPDKPNTTPLTRVNTPEQKATRFNVDSLTLPERTAWFEFCKVERPDLDAIKTLDSFSDFWKGRPGEKGRKLDWLATWRNWVRNQKQGGNGGVKGMPAAAIEYLRRGEATVEKEIPGERVG